MFLFFGNNGVQVMPEIDWEACVISSPQLQSKLAYEITFAPVETIDRWHVRFVPDCFAIHAAEREVLLPCGLSQDALGYALRIVIDGLLLDHGKIPFHSAAVASPHKQIFLFAGPGKGKSHFARYICKQLDGFALVGDDHVILDSDTIIGNSMCRIRDLYSQTIGYLENVRYAQCTYKIALCIQYADINQIEEIYEKDLQMENLLACSAFKYLMHNPVMQGKLFALHDVFGMDKKMQYADRARDCTFDAFFRVTGSFEYIEQVIMHDLKIYLECGVW